MIHYDLRCAVDHAFDGWFKSSAAFEHQAETGLVACPECGDTRIRRALMAPSVARRPMTIDAEPASASVPAPQPDPAPTPAARLGAELPDQVRAALQRLRAEIERNSDYVGNAFADEARRIHNGEAERRSIYGEATEAETEALREDGIAFARIPWVKPSDA